MGKCIDCGRKGLLLRVNAYGRCQACQERYAKEEEKKKIALEEKRKQLEKIRAEAERKISVTPAFVDISTLDVSKESFDMVPDCVVTDIETTGLSSYSDSIIEIAAIKIVDGKVVGAYSSLVHRDAPLDDRIRDLTGITTEMLRKCQKDLDTVISEYNSFIGDLPLVGHNIKKFDIQFIDRAYKRVFGRSIDNECIDTLSLSRKYVRDVADYKLQTLVRYLGIISSGEHRALADCESTTLLYKHLCINMPAQSDMPLYELNENDDWIIKMTRRIFENEEHSYFRYQRTKQYLKGECGGEIFRIKTTGKLKNYIVFIRPLEEDVLKDITLETTPTSSADGGGTTRIFFKNEEGFMSLADRIVMAYRKQMDEINSDMELVHNDNAGFIRSYGCTSYEKWFYEYLNDSNRIKL